MHSQTTRQTTVPPELSSPRAKLVYLYLATHGTAELDELQDGLGLKKITLYSVLKTLTERGFVGRSGERYALA